jgi:Methyltransferase domain
MAHLADFQQLLRQTEASPKVIFENEVLSGFSGRRMIAALQGFAQLLDPAQFCYLEVGVFQGLTLLSVAGANPEVACFGIDNFQAHDPEKKNLNIFNQRREKLGLANAHLLNLDYEDALENLGQHLGRRKIGVYFIDGPHDYRSQLMCLLLAMPHLASNAIIVVDDSNYLQVRQANRDFLVAHPAYKLLFEAYTPRHPNNMTPEQTAAARQGWWDGVNILVRDPANSLPPLYPPTRRNRLLFENDHFVHASRIGAIAPQVLAAANLLFTGRWGRAAKNFRRAYQMYKANPLPGQFDDTNIFTEGVPESRLNG